MRVIEIGASFGLDQLRVAERPPPVPGPGQVLLQMQAASLNYRDLLTVLGRYNPRQPLPLIPGSDGVGEVVELGAGVSRVAQGDRVAPIFAQRWLAGPLTTEAMDSTLGGPLDGVLAEYMVVGAESLVRAPDHLSDEEVACLPCAAVTAWSALVEHGRLQAGQSVVVQGTGGVSIFALQLANVLGARTIVTSSSDEKLERARALGAWQTINYRTTPEWGRKVRELTGDGADLVVEVGGAETLPQSLAAIRPDGRICLIGVLSGTSARLNVVHVLMRRVRVQGVFVGSRQTFEALNRALTTHAIRPAIHRIFPMHETRSALELLASGAHLGKICLRIS